MADYRLYIDESGDHTYKLLDDESRRYLGITGVLCWKPRYDKPSHKRSRTSRGSTFATIQISRRY